MTPAYSPPPRQRDNKIAVCRVYVRACVLTCVCLRVCACAVHVWAQVEVTDVRLSLLDVAEVVVRLESFSLRTTAREGGGDREGWSRLSKEALVRGLAVTMGAPTGGGPGGGLDAGPAALEGHLVRPLALRVTVVKHESQRLVAGRARGAAALDRILAGEVGRGARAAVGEGRASLSVKVPKKKKAVLSF